MMNDVAIVPVTGTQKWGIRRSNGRYTYELTIESEREFEMLGRKNLELLIASQKAALDKNEEDRLYFQEAIEAFTYLEDAVQKSPDLIEKLAVVFARIYGNSKINFDSLERDLEMGVGKLAICTSLSSVDLTELLQYHQIRSDELKDILSVLMRAEKNVPYSGGSNIPPILPFMCDPSMFYAGQRVEVWLDVRRAKSFAYTLDFHDYYPYGTYIFRANEKGLVLETRHVDYEMPGQSPERIMTIDDFEYYLRHQEYRDFLRQRFKQWRECDLRDCTFVGILSEIDKMATWPRHKILSYL